MVICYRGSTEDRGNLSRLSPPVPGARGGRGHTCRPPPRACSVGNTTSPSASATLAREPQSAGWLRHSGWTAKGAAGRFLRLKDSGEDHLTGKHVPNAGGHTPFVWTITSMYLLLPASAQWLHLGSGCRPTARKVLGSTASVEILGLGPWLRGSVQRRHWDNPRGCP